MISQADGRRVSDGMRALFRQCSPGDGLASWWEISGRDKYAKHGELETFAWLCLILLFNMEEVLCIYPSVHGTPFADAQKDANNEVLGTICPPFEAEFYGGKGQPEDGWVSWNKAVVANTKENTNYRVDPYSVPLEVGDSTACKTLAQVLAGGVARWPYKSNRVHVLLLKPGKTADELQRVLLMSKLAPPAIEEVSDDESARIVTTVLVVCSRCQRDLRPMEGDKYEFVKQGDRWRPVCKDCRRRS